MICLCNVKKTPTLRCLAALIHRHFQDQSSYECYSQEIIPSALGKQMRRTLMWCCHLGWGARKYVGGRREQSSLGAPIALTLAFRPSSPSSLGCCFPLFFITHLNRKIIFLLPNSWRIVIAHLLLREKSARAHLPWAPSHFKCKLQWLLWKCNRLL